MKKFHSRLQSLQRLREQQEQLARAQVAACQQQSQQAGRLVEESRRRLHATSDAVNQLFTQQPDLATVNGSRALYRRQQEQLLNARMQQHVAEAAVEKALADWHAARAELKGINSRIESQRAVHRRDAFLQEEHRQQETAAQTRFRRVTEATGVSES